MNFKMMSSLAVAPLAVAGVMGSMDSANAAGLVGNMAITGDGVRIGINSFQFLDGGTPTNPAPYTVTTTGTDGSFTQFIGSNAAGNDKGGFIYSLPPVAPAPGAVAGNRLLDLGNLDGVLTFHVNTILPANFNDIALVPGGCTGPNLNNCLVSASIGLTGLFVDQNGIITRGTGVFTTQFTNTNTADIVATILEDGFIENSFSGATLAVQAVPEPFTMAGSALALGAMGYFKRKQSAKKAAGVA
jgi:hypothetical protein